MAALALGTVSVGRGTRRPSSSVRGVRRAAGAGGDLRDLVAARARRRAATSRSRRGPRPSLRLRPASAVDGPRVYAWLAGWVIAANLFLLAHPGGTGAVGPPSAPSTVLGASRGRAPPRWTVDPLPPVPLVDAEPAARPVPDLVVDLGDPGAVGVAPAASPARCCSSCRREDVAHAVPRDAAAELARRPPSSSRSRSCRRGEDADAGDRIRPARRPPRSPGGRARVRRGPARPAIARSSRHASRRPIARRRSWAAARRSPR